MGFEFSWKTDSITEHKVLFNPIYPSSPSTDNSISINGRSFGLIGLKDDTLFVLNSLSQKNFQSFDEFSTALKDLKNPLITKHSAKIIDASLHSTQRITKATFFSRLKTEDVIPQEFKEYLKQLEEHQAFSGVISISWGNSEPMTVIAGGQVAQIPFTSATPFNIMSAGKAFTAAAILQLVEKNNEFKLETPLVKIGLSNDDYHLYKADKKYLYDLRPNPNYEMEVEAAIENFKANPNVTIRHLLQHKSGLIDDKDVKGLRFNEKMLDHYKYSNYGYQILARVISKVAGVPFTEYIKENIFKVSGAEGNVSSPGDEPTPHFCVLGKLEKNIGPEMVVSVPNTESPWEKESMKNLLKHYAEKGIASEYNALSKKLDATDKKTIAVLMREVDYELQAESNKKD